MGDPDGALFFIVGLMCLSLGGQVGLFDVVVLRLEAKADVMVRKPGSDRSNIGTTIHALSRGQNIMSIDDSQYS
jgi:hypothetical protein